MLWSHSSSFCKSCLAAFISASHLVLLKSPVSQPQVFATYTVALYLPFTLSTSKWGLGFPWSLQYFSNCSLGLPAPPEQVDGGAVQLGVGMLTLSSVFSLVVVPAEWVRPRNDSSKLWAPFLPLIFCLNAFHTIYNIMRNKFDQCQQYLYDNIPDLDNGTGKPMQCHMYT